VKTYEMHVVKKNNEFLGKHQDGKPWWTLVPAWAYWWANWESAEEERKLHEGEVITVTFEA
jgi:hypothetical protein